MSHSDSELNKSRDAYKKKLNVAFKAKHLMNRLSRTQYAQLKKSLRSLKHSKVLIAAAQNNVEVVTNQLNSGANPNCADMHGRSPLHLAASKGYIDIVKLLLEKGADPNIQDKLKNTPLHLAACSHNFQIISLLLHAGADVRNLDLYGKNPLHLAQSKLQLLQRSWREGSIEMAHVRTQLQLIVDILLAVLKQSTLDSRIDERMKSKMLDLDVDVETVDDQMSELLQELEGVNIS